MNLDLPIKVEVRGTAKSVYDKATVMRALELEQKKAEPSEAVVDMLLGLLKDLETKDASD